MGREDVAVCHWQGDVAEVRLHLDSKELTLRGDFRAAVGRDQMRAVDLVDMGVAIRTDRGDLLIELAHAEAVRWQHALLKRPPTLAQKLGVTADAPAFVTGFLDDPDLAAALDGCTVQSEAASQLLIGVVQSVDEMERASELAVRHPSKHIWMLCRKGKAAPVAASTIRTHMRGLGFIDSKSCAVSDQLTAVRYRMKSE